MDLKESEVLKARIREAVKHCRERNALRFVGFLDPHGAATAVSEAKRDGVKFMLFGGYPEAERRYFGVFPEWSECDESAFPIVKLKVLNKSDRRLSHRDFLGSVMALGLERDTVGDILVGHPETFLFVSSTVADYIVSQLSKIGSCGVLVERDDSEKLPPFVGFSEGSDTVASARLDCVVSSLAKTSRGKAAELIENGFVSVGGIAVTKVTKIVAEGDVISVRKIGKFLIDGVSDLTRKNRIILKYRKYI